MANEVTRRTLPRSFYDRPTLVVAADLIGKVLVHERRGRRTAGVIVETEAYIGEDDPACHAASGLTPRNAPLYGPAGHAYVYFTYGMHHLVNAVTEEEGFPAAVLIRALAPLEGLDLMYRRRGWPAAARADPGRRQQLCQGPGNLTVALGIARARNRAPLDRAPLTIEDHGIRPPAIDRSPRIGIRVGTDRLWRFAWTGHGAISGKGKGQRAKVKRRSKVGRRR
jgi:DNA-3-methyladenine glycosylase